MRLVIFDRTENEESYADVRFVAPPTGEKSFCYEEDPPLGLPNPTETILFGQGQGRFATWMYSTHSYLVNLRIYRDECLGTPEYYFPFDQLPI